MLSEGKFCFRQQYCESCNVLGEENGLSCYSYFRVIKGLALDGPIILPKPEDLPYLARPYSEEEKAAARQVAAIYGFAAETEALPLQVVGSGSDLNMATANGLERMSALTGLPVAEVKNWATITGDIQIDRLPGVMQVTMLMPAEVMEKLNILKFFRDHCGA